MNDNEKSGNAPHPTYQAIPQPGSAPAAYPNEPPPMYEQQGYNSGYQQPQGYTTQAQPVYVPAQTTLVVHPQIGFGSNPRRMQCPHCQADITTTLHYEAGALTWLSSGLLCIFGCWLGCCLIPFCIQDLSDIQHKCPNCNKLVGVHRKLS